MAPSSVHDFFHGMSGAAEAPDGLLFVAVSVNTDRRSGCFGWMCAGLLSSARVSCDDLRRASDAIVQDKD